MITFNSFNLQDSNFITERVEFKGLADRDVIRARVNRREGISLLNTEYSEKTIVLSGVVIASSGSELQGLLDDLKKNIQQEEADLVLEDGRTWTATNTSLSIPDEHYSQSMARFEAEFLCTNPYAVGSLLTAVKPVISGVFTYSGMVNISGTYFARPTITYTPAGAANGRTNIKNLVLYHVPTGQSMTVSGFGSGVSLNYSDVVIINMDSFTALEGASSIDSDGAFMRWEPGDNDYTITVSGRHVGGSVTVAYQPRYI